MRVQPPVIAAPPNTSLLSGAMLGAYGEMVPADRRNTSILTVLGFLLMVSAPETGSLGPPVLAIGTGILGYALIVVSCFYYARGKGYSPWLGLWGLLWLPGILVLYLCPDRNKHLEKPARPRTDDVNAAPDTPQHQPGGAGVTSEGPRE